MQSITLEALVVLDAIDRMGSFAAAANVLYRVPSSVTYTVQKLEQDLGVTLFTKQGRRSVLTPAGQVLLEQGRELLAAADKLEETTKAIDSGWESRINIVVDTAIDTSSIFSVIERFYAIKPDIEINLYQEALAGGWEALQEGRAHLALGLPKKPKDVSGVEVLQIGKDQWVFVVKSGHPLTQLEQPLQQTDIENYRNVVVRDTSSNHAKLNYRLFSKQPVLSVQTIDDKIKAQQAGLGVGFLPKSKIQKQLNSGELVALEVYIKDIESPYFMAWRRGKKGKALAWFIDALKV